MEKVLLVEDSPAMIKILTQLLNKNFDFKVVSCRSLAETQKILEHDTDFLVAILDLTLPDAPDGEVVDYVLEKKVPSIVMTARFDEGLRKSIINKQVVDYVTKEHRYSFDYLIKLIRRLDLNRQIKTLIVDDSNTTRKFISSLLKRQNFQVMEACDGVEAMDILQREPEIKLMITDYNMPNMDGFELITQARKKIEKDNLAIIGLSAQGNSLLSTKFIKNGANDFLTKPFFHEELYCRIIQNIEAIERIEEVREAANRDYLTSLYNRRYFYQAGQELYQRAVEEQSELSMAMLDIDHFKKINDNYSHDAGDRVLRHMAKQMNKYLAGELIARLGGEEFVILFPNTPLHEAMLKLEVLRSVVEESWLNTDEGTIKYTVSIGLTDQKHTHLDEMLKDADQLLYQAKETGRNRVIPHV